MALALGVAVAAVLLWLLNPYAALLAVPAAHLWMLAALTRPAPPRRARAVLVALGALPALIVVDLLPVRALARSAGAASGISCCS